MEGNRSEAAGLEAALLEAVLLTLEEEGQLSAPACRRCLEALRQEADDRARLTRPGGGERAM